MTIHITLPARHYEVNCCAECPHCGREMGGILVCEHEDAPHHGYIIKGNEFRDKISEHCPLEKES